MNILYSTWLIFNRNVKITLRNPVWVFIGLFQPLCFLLFFAPLLKNLSFSDNLSAGINPITVFTPGLLVMMALYGCSFVGFGLLDDMRSGIIERFKIAPISQFSYLLSRSIRDIFILLIQSFIIIFTARFMGLQANFTGTLLTFALLALVGLTMTSVSYAFALILKNEDALAPVINFFLLPLQLLSGILLPLSLAPNWIQKVSLLNPLSYVVDATRSLFYGNLIDLKVFLGFFLMLICSILATKFAVKAYKSES